MKAKVKFDKKLILGFFINHGEKIVFGAIALVALFLVYSSMGTETFPKEPDELLNRVKQANHVIQQGSTDIKDDAAKIVKPDDQIKDVKIDTKPYEFVQILKPVIYEPKTLRGQPILFPPQDGKGTGGLGKFDRLGIAGGGGMVGPRGRIGGGATAADQPKLGQRYVVITAYLDLEKYRQSFYDCFKNTRRHSETDYVPDFRFFVVERAEITSEDEPEENLQWEQPYTNLAEEFKRFQSSGDLAEQKYINTILVSPLPTRKDGLTWGKEVVHPPEIPLIGSNPLGTGEQPGAEEATPGGAPIAPGGDPFGGQGRLGGGRVGPMAGGGGGGMFDGGGMVGGGMIGGRTGGLDSTTPYYLVRFFDYNVEPGKRYRYRIKVALTNPNLPYPAQDLNEDLRKQMKDKTQWGEFIYSDWSELTEVIPVPRDDRLLASSVTPARGIDREPKGEVMAIHWTEQTGNEISDEFEISRGMLANFYEQDIPNAVNPLGGPAAGPGARGPMLGPGGDMFGPGGADRQPRRGRQRQPAGRRRQPQPAAPPTEKIDYVTEMLVLDMRGGDKLPGRNDLTSPGEFLLLDPDGNLEVRDASDDREERLDQKDPTRRQATRGRMGPGGGMIPPPAGGGGMFD